MAGWVAGGGRRISDRQRLHAAAVDRLARCPQNSSLEDESESVKTGGLRDCSDKTAVDAEEALPSCARVGVSRSLISLSISK